MRILAAASLLTAGSLLASPQNPAAGMPLREALQVLEGRGVRLLYTSQLVRPEMRVVAPPEATEPLAVARELLAPHGLTLAPGPGAIWIVVRLPAPAIPKRAPPPPLRPVIHQEILVRARPVPPLEQPPGTNLLTEEDLAILPGAGDDVFRSLTQLPGTTAGDTSASLHVRGARTDELQVVLDGQELYAPFHLQDFDNALSIVGTSALGAVNLMTGALPASYGDRSAAVLDMVTTAPQERLRLSASLLGVQAEAADTFGAGAGRWLTLIRRGTSGPLGRSFEVTSSRFSDLFAKLDLGFTASQNIGLRTLLTEDELNFTARTEIKEIDTEYLSGYGWLTHQIVIGDRLAAESTISTAQLVRDRRGMERDAEKSFLARDERDTQTLSLTHAWSVEVSSRHLLNAGIDYRSFETSYDYDNTRGFPLSSAPQTTFAFHEEVETEQAGVFVSNRLALPGALTIHGGLRADQHSGEGGLGEPRSSTTLLSPRLSGSWSVSDSTVLRLAWGRYTQSQRAYELLVEDGDARLYSPERAAQWLIGAEHVFPGPTIPISSVRLEIYRRTVEEPRPRYVSLFDTFDPFPEGQSDRVRIAPERSMSQGVELAIRGRRTRRASWTLHYAWATVRDRLAGAEVRREIDQTHTLQILGNVNLGNRWSVGAGWLYRSGWPSTPLMLQAGPEGTVTIVPGALHSSRLPAYHRLDVRVAREWELRRGTLGFFADVRNLYNRRNVAGRDVNVTEDGVLESEREVWPGLVPSAGISWRFR